MNLSMSLRDISFSGNLFGRHFERAQDEIVYLVNHDSASNQRRLIELIDSTKDPFVGDESGWLPLHHAASVGNHEAIKTLMMKGHPFCESSTYTPLGITAVSFLSLIVTSALLSIWPVIVQ